MYFMSFVIRTKEQPPQGLLEWLKVKTSAFGVTARVTKYSVSTLNIETSDM